jgi:hypothetical protein
MFRGIPKLFAYTARLIKVSPHRSSDAIVAYHLLSDIVNAANHILYHYLTLTLEEDFLQKSGRGTPYQKWALVNNENFHNFDNKVRSLISVVYEIYNKYDVLYSCELGARSRNSGDWFTHVGQNYVACTISTGETTITISEINFNGWLSKDGVLFSSIRANLRKRALLITDDLPFNEKMGQQFIIKSDVSIKNRAVLNDLQQEGEVNVKSMKVSIERLGGWLKRNYSINDVCKNHINDIGRYTDCRLDK